ncbi:AAA family ATPase [Magnetospirillum molischianum]|uniref:AAA+ ATPase domain-containing protein n=1 Tax=Magnetospirillum molischianum DSM 120 TaxID=1150626 RepID=H8FTV9_MAGML|nr:helicase RepA family protein [Magnetospirillum molischianum]CCG41816.1 hypothetical protein PHAMO_290104 [Magnetospirillum molischianum DSM 120]
MTSAIPLEEAERLARQQTTPPPPVEDGPPWEAEAPSAPRLLPTLRYVDIEASIGTADFVEGLLIDGGLSLAFGASNSGKTFLVTDMGLHVALGWPWHGREVEAGGVLYVAGEGGSGIKNRIAAFRSHHGAAAAGEMVPFAVVPATIDLCDPTADTGALIATIRAMTEAFGMPVRLVIVDTVSRAMAGGDENASGDMGALVRNLDRVREETGVHILLVHHSGKDTARGARGHSLLRAAVDTEIEVSRDEEAGVSVAKVTKQRDLPVAGELSFRLEVVELGTNRRGKKVTSCVVVAADTVPTRKPASLSPGQKLALDQLKNSLADHGQTYRDNRDIPPVPVVVAKTWREQLKRAGVTDRDNPENERKQFRRHVEALMSKGFIRMLDDLVWLAGQSGTERDNGTSVRAGTGTDRDTLSGGCPVRPVPPRPAVGPVPVSEEPSDWELA